MRVAGGPAGSYAVLTRLSSNDLIVTVYNRSGGVIVPGVLVNDADPDPGTALQSLLAKWTVLSGTSFSGLAALDAPIATVRRATCALGLVLNAFKSRRRPKSERRSAAMTLLPRDASSAAMMASRSARSPGPFPPGTSRSAGA